MQNIPRYVTSIPLKNLQARLMNIFLGFEENGAIGLYFSDTSELGQDSNYINENSFPNTGSQSCGMYSLWLSVFSKYANCFPPDEETFETS